MRCVLVPIHNEGDMERECRTCEHKDGDNIICYWCTYPKLPNWQPKEQPMKYKMRDGGFTIADWIRAEECDDYHFYNDIKIVVSEWGFGFSFPFWMFKQKITEIPAHFHECNTMKRKFLEFGFVEEVKEKRTCKNCRFSYKNNGTGLYCEDFAPKQCEKPCGHGNNYPNFMPIVEKK